MHKFLTPLDVTFIDGKSWVVKSPFVYQVNENEIVSIPPGFETDFASVPRGLWNVFPPTGEYAPAAVVHDWLYRRRVIVNITDNTSRLVNRGEADSILRKASGLLGTNAFTRWTMYTMLRSFGWAAWRSARAKDQDHDQDTN